MWSCSRGGAYLHHEVHDIRRPLSAIHGIDHAPVDGFTRIREPPQDVEELFAFFVGHGIGVLDGHRGWDCLSKTGRVESSVQDRVCGLGPVPHRPSCPSPTNCGHGCAPKVPRTTFRPRAMGTHPLSSQTFPPLLWCSLPSSGLVRKPSFAKKIRQKRDVSGAAFRYPPPYSGPPPNECAYPNAVARAVSLPQRSRRHLFGLPRAMGVWQKGGSAEGCVTGGGRGRAQGPGFGLGAGAGIAAVAGFARAGGTAGMAGGIQTGPDMYIWNGATRHNSILSPCSSE